MLIKELFIIERKEGRGGGRERKKKKRKRFRGLTVREALNILQIMHAKEKLSDMIQGINSWS